LESDGSSSAGEFRQGSMKLALERKRIF
jgi:hypothetical protein